MTRARARAILLVAAAVLGLAAAAADWRAAAAAATLTAAIDADHGYIAAPDLASRIVAGDPNLRVVDLRSKSAFEQLHIPGARQMPLADLAHEASWPQHAMVVLYSEGDAGALQAWLQLRARGYTRVFVLREGIYEWVGRVLEPRLAVDATEAERTEFARTSELSRFFGGLALAGVPRAEVPRGYWTGTPRSQAQLATSSRQAIATIRRRGC